MMEQSHVVFLLLFLTGCALLGAGCTLPRVGDAHNTTVVIQDYNTWTDQQKAYYGDVHFALTQLGTTLDTYNHDTAGDSLDPGPLHGDVAADQQALARWGAGSAALGTATDTFSSETASLDFGNDQDTLRLTELLGQEMKIYSIDMGNAQQHFIDYERDLSGYLSVDDPDYRDDSLRMAAIDAKAAALSSLSDGDDALSNITATAHLLQGRQ